MQLIYVKKDFFPLSLYLFFHNGKLFEQFFNDFPSSILWFVWGVESSSGKPNQSEFKAFLREFSRRISKNIPYSSGIRRFITTATTKKLLKFPQTDLFPLTNLSIANKKWKIFFQKPRTTQEFSEKYWKMETKSHSIDYKTNNSELFFK